MIHTFEVWRVTEADTNVNLRPCAIDGTHPTGLNFPKLSYVKIILMVIQPKTPVKTTGQMTDSLTSILKTL